VARGLGVRMSEETASTSGSWSISENEEEVVQNVFGAQSPPVALKPAKKLKAKPVKEILEKVLPQLQRRDQYQFFAMPVESIEVPEYYTIIKNPMDFSTMERKLAEGEYGTVDTFKVSLLIFTIW
jgi:hypothetical protein